MATRIWGGGAGAWVDAVNWIGNIVPSPADVAVVQFGTLELPTHAQFDGYSIDVGSNDSTRPAILFAPDTTIGHYTLIESKDPGRYAALWSSGITAFAGAVDAASSGGSFSIAGPDGATGSDALILLNGAEVRVSNGDLMAEWGVLTNHGLINVAAGGIFYTSGTIAQSDGFFVVQSAGTLTGTGEIDLGLSSALYLLSGSTASQSVRFTAPGALLEMNPGSFSGQIVNLRAGDNLVLDGIAADAAV
jgi:hypothetical protein